MANKMKDLINKCKELMSRCLPIKNPSIDSDRTASVNDSRTSLSNSTLNDERATWEIIADMTHESLMDRNPQIPKETEKSQHILPDDITNLSDTETTQINILQSEPIDPTYGYTNPMYRQPEKTAKSPKADGHKRQMSHSSNI